MGDDYAGQRKPNIAAHGPLRFPSAFKLDIVKILRFAEGYDAVSEKRDIFPVLEDGLPVSALATSAIASAANAALVRKFINRTFPQRWIPALMADDASGCG